MTPDLSHSITLRPHPFCGVSSSSSFPTLPSRLVSFPEQPSHAELAPNSDGVHHDVESQAATCRAGREHTCSGLSVETDPFGLSSSYKSKSDLALIRAQHRLSSSPNTASFASTSGTADTIAEARSAKPGGSSESRLTGQPSLGLRLGNGQRRARRLKGFYQSQNAAIERMLKSVEEHRAEARQEQGEDHLRVQIAVYGSFVANVILSGLQTFAAVKSGSLSLFSTMADAIFDPLCSVTLILTSRAVSRVDPRRFPAGKARLGTVGNIVFSFLMTAVALIILAFAAHELALGVNATMTSDIPHPEFQIAPIMSVVAAFVTKLVLFIYCFTLKKRHSQVRILWQDHRNDLLINAFGIMTSVGGTKLKWWIDPAGAIVISVVITVLWLRTAFEEFLLLVGVAASVETQQLITYVCLTHSDAIRGIDTVRVYHSGPRLIAEVDIVMDPSASLMATHDVAEALQIKLESLPDVERAYVHIDYETTHKPEHTWKKDL